jgi:hypothetical protein
VKKTKDERIKSWPGGGPDYFPRGKVNNRLDKGRTRCPNLTSQQQASREKHSPRSKHDHYLVRTP